MSEKILHLDMAESVIDLMWIKGLLTDVQRKNCLKKIQEKFSK